MWKHSFWGNWWNPNYWAKAGAPDNSVAPANSTVGDPPEFDAEPAGGHQLLPRIQMVPYAVIPSESEPFTNRSPFFTDIGPNNRTFIHSFDAPEANSDVTVALQVKAEISGGFVRLLFGGQTIANLLTEVALADECGQEFVDATITRDFWNDNLTDGVATVIVQFFFRPFVTTCEGSNLKITTSYTFDAPTGAASYMGWRSAQLTRVGHPEGAEHILKGEWVLDPNTNCLACQIRSLPQGTVSRGGMNADVISGVEEPGGIAGALTSTVVGELRGTVLRVTTAGEYIQI